jgi:hypothetical protein
MSPCRALLAPLLTVVAVLGIHLPASSADEASVALRAEAATFLDENPGGSLEGTEVVYPDGSGFVAVAESVSSLSQCADGRFCMWGSTNFTGSFTYVSGSGLKPLTATVKSFYNDRSYVARLSNNAGTASTCYGPGATVASVAATSQSPAQVRLGVRTTC